ncbi:ABC-type dipeptide transport system, periplasmic component [Candidatus Vecturithrix granuli]|uniref:ABC-type dipeptide transport system, periplasmic component n=1 Tax=Vecturithrix granuli TaxID=1499967 RepID=A0A081C111_VECG1|nr:ABC-type dipeptide transport system, periplasmic component [Candidatus Vecturithrix granuli]
MKNTIKGMLSLLLIIMLLQILAALGYAQPQKDILRVGAQTSAMLTLDPARTTGEGTTVILSHLYNKLVDFEFGDSTRIVPDLAESWEIVPDGKTWVFHLKHDATFASGNPVTAADVVFSLQRVLRIAETPSRRLSQFGVTPESISKIDEYTVQIVLKRQYAPQYFLSCLAYPSVGSILDQQLVLQHEENNDFGSAWLSLHAAGSGPFVVEQWVPGQGLTLNVREHFWENWTPFFNKLTVKEMDPLLQMTMVQKGDIDLAWNLRPEQIHHLRQNPDLYMYETPEFTIMYLGMNVGYEPLSRSEVRDAIRYAIDYDAIMHEILQDAAIKIQTIIPQGIFGYNPATPYNFDLEKAKNLLAEAGYPDGFEVELLCAPSHPWSAIAVKLQSDLAKIGIHVSLKFMDGLELYTTYQTQAHQMVLAQWQSDYADPNDNAMAFAHSTSVDKDAKVLSLAWRNKYVNPEIAALVDEAAYELDRDRRAALYQTITEKILDDGPFAVLGSPLRQVVARFEDFEVPPSFFMFDASTFK